MNNDTENEWSFNKTAQESLKKNLLSTTDNTFNIYNVQATFRRPCISSPDGSWKIGTDVETVPCTHKRKMYGTSYVILQHSDRTSIQRYLVMLPAPGSAPVHDTSAGHAA